MDPSITPFARMDAANARHIVLSYFSGQLTLTKAALPLGCWLLVMGRILQGVLGMGL